MKPMLLLYLTFMLVAPQVFSQQTRCCDMPACKQRAEQLAAKVSGLAVFIKCKDGNRAANAATLDSLRRANIDLYNDFIATMQALVLFMNDHPQDMCFADRLPDGLSDNIFDWIIYFNDAANPVKFPSAEFCRGWKKRVEINQGAAGLFKPAMTYLGSLRAYLAYTFAKKNNCGGMVRLMTGPAGFLRGNASYLALSTRAAFRLKDIAPKHFALGNINLFGEYNTNFNHFNNIAAGAEIELSTYGVNLAVNYDTKNNFTGFLVGVVLANKKIK